MNHTTSLHMRKPLFHNVLEGAVQQFTVWRERARERQLLAQLSDRELRDIRLNRQQAQFEASKPFWKP